jgi:hypothetical protein
MKYLATVWVSALVIALAIPTLSHAYFTTNQEAFTVNGSVGVFVIDFSFGHERHEVHIPVSAKRDSVHTPAAMAYDVVDANGVSGRGSSVGIVLSDAKIKNGEYVVPKGVSESFRLLVLYTKGASDTETAFRTQVTHLPFSFNGTTNLQLNPSELQYYTTKLVPMSTHATISAPGK